MNKQQTADIFMEEGDIDALYLRLSRDDEHEGESNSIANQRTYLKEYAKKNGFRNVRIFVDDGVSGATFQRSGFQEMMALIGSGQSQNCDRERHEPLWAQLYRSRATHRSCVPAAQRAPDRRQRWCGHRQRR